MSDNGITIAIGHGSFTLRCYSINFWGECGQEINNHIETECAYFNQGVELNTKLKFRVQNFITFSDPTNVSFLPNLVPKVQKEENRILIHSGRCLLKS